MVLSEIVLDECAEFNPQTANRIVLRKTIYFYLCETITVQGLSHDSRRCPTKTGWTSATGSWFQWQHIQRPVLKFLVMMPRSIEHKAKTCFYIQARHFDVENQHSYSTRYFIRICRRMRKRYCISLYRRRWAILSLCEGMSSCPFKLNRRRRNCSWRLPTKSIGETSKTDLSRNLPLFVYLKYV